MKMKLLTTLFASMAMVSCGGDKEETKTEVKVKANTVYEVEKATPSKVSGSLATVAQKFDGEKYSPTKLAHNIDYFIVYYTASW